MPNGTRPPDFPDQKVGWDKKSWQKSFVLGVASGVLAPFLVGLIIVLAGLGLVDPGTGQP